MSPSFRRFAYKIKDNVILCQKVVWTRGARVNSPVQCCAYVCAKPLQSCLILCNPMNCGQPGFSVHGILQEQEHCSGLPCSPPGDLPNPGIETMSLMSPELTGGFLTTSATWEAPVLYQPCDHFF